MLPRGCILATGGAGYIGSHTIVELLEAGYEVVAIDNFANAHAGDNAEEPESLRRVSKITGKPIKFYKVDMLDEASVDDVFKKHKFDAVIHFAALKAVGESCQIPLEYYKNNLGSTTVLLQTMRRYGCRNFIFSSSATVYGIPQYLPIDERHPTGQGCTNPYGRTKYFIEEMLKDLYRSEEGWNVMLLRYFNPVGAHESGLIGEYPMGIPNNLMPYISQVAIGKRSELSVFGDDFDTVDGTGVRDYIHVVDLAKGHVAALNKIMSGAVKGCKAYNLGASRGYSVLEMIKAFEKASGRNIPYKIVGRREGDVDQMYADCSLANKELEWKAELSLDKMCEDTWRWQSKNPNGYQSTNGAS